MATLSLCMTVRDEAPLLPKFLEALKGAYDELCVVDTGSQDGSMALLRDAGAKITQFAWADDFSQARNASLQMARGDFILVLDPDEIVQPGFAQELRELIADPFMGAATVRLRNHLEHGHLHESDVLRLFRRDFGAAYRYRIHEEITTAVQAALISRNLNIGALKTPIVHLGYSREVVVARGKKPRDTGLLWACVGDDPDDLYSWYKLLEQGRFHKDEALTAAAADGGNQALTRAGDPAQHGHFLPDFIVLLAEALGKTEPQAAEALLLTWCEKMPDSPALLHARGLFFETQGLWNQAAADFSRCLELDGKSANRQITSVRPRLGLARLALAQADFAAAQGHVDASLRLAPQDPEALLARRALEGMRGFGAAPSPCAP